MRRRYYKRLSVYPYKQSYYKKGHFKKSGQIKKVAKHMHKSCGGMYDRNLLIPIEVQGVSLSIKLRFY